MRRYLPVLLLTILLGNALAILCFNYFITLDGPVHVFQASLLETPWPSTDQIAHGITYDIGTLRFRLGHYVLKTLLFLVPPIWAHDLFAAFVSCVVVLSLIAVVRAHGIRVGPAFLWFAPLTFNLLLIIGLFHFLLGVAICLGTLAWWISRRATPLWRYAGLVAGAALAWSAHRSAPLLLCMFVLPTLLIGLKPGWKDSFRRAHRSPFWYIVFIGLSLFLVMTLDLAAPGIHLRVSSGFPKVDLTLLARPLVLPEIGMDRWPVQGIGILLLVSIVAGTRARWSVGKGLQWHDIFLVFFLGFILISWLLDSPTGRRLLIPERSQWLALICLVIWIIAMADGSRGWPRRAIVFAAVCAFPLHGIRLVQASEYFTQAKVVHDQIIEAVNELQPGSLVLPVMAGPGGMMQRLNAYIAIEHDGIIMSPNDPLRLRAPSTLSNTHWVGAVLADHHWLRKWRKGLPTDVDHVLFTGRDIERKVHSHPWNVLLPSRYRLTYSNDHAWVYTNVSE